MDFNTANEVVHPVEKQWHFETMVKHGFKPITKEAKGFVRRYVYENANGYRIECNTGYSASYFNDPQVEWSFMNNNGGRYWGNLENYLKIIAK